jgi:hypothetical protein
LRSTSSTGRRELRALEFEDSNLHRISSAARDPAFSPVTFRSLQRISSARAGARGETDMRSDHSANDHPPSGSDLEAPMHPSRWKRNLALAVFAAASAYFLLTEHYAHTMQALPWLVFLACPLMHVFMHRGHGSHER